MRTLSRERLDDRRIVVAVGAHDGLTATLAQRAGFEAVYHGGYAVAAHHHGLPDIGLVGLGEVSASLLRMTAVADVPVLVDADTGYGSEPGVKRAVQELERAGAAAVQIEDQVFPKRCGHMEGKRVIPRDEMVLKVRAALEARRDPDTLVIARTDALQVNGLDDAINRCNAYAEAGADVTFVDAPRTRDELARIARDVHGPSLANMSETGRSPALTAEELEALGYKIVIFPSTQTWLFARVYQDLLDELQSTGTSMGLRDRMMPFDDVNDLLGLGRWQP
ncbi:MAG TPA: isocitrate lyase/phosphoenolpyruvate mutase family protein [Solirubrobacteraceae bacterium]|nr:isocitrate lyase/phosphoenolpyruvate mutase family protein [Solirubrobacteraceae bacterium]